MKALKIAWAVLPGTHIHDAAKQAETQGFDAFIHNDLVFLLPFQSEPIGTLKELALKERHREDD